ncbi:MAG: LysR family transcriptional regulator [Paracoccaceae bacterium]|nr:LysR family transcriptional regulator [Paracoccaceae bacterium]
MNLNGFDLNLLRVLDALLREGSTVKAGERVGLSQPAVSAALKRLRESLNDPLFVRQGKGLVPTKFAKEIELPLHSVLDQVQSLLTASVQFDPRVSEQIFRISGSDFFAEMLMPQLASRVSELAPNMRVLLVDLVPDNYIDTLEKNSVDLALLPTLDFPDWVDSRPVFRSRYAMIARTDHIELKRAKVSAGAPVPLDLFCKLGHLLMSPEGKLRSHTDEKLATMGRKRQVIMTMPFFSGIIRTVAQSDLVALIPERLARHMAPQMGLEIYQPPMNFRVELLKMAWHKRFTNDPAHRWLRDQIAELLLPLNENEEPLV